MKIAIISFPPTDGSIGGEDQISEYLLENFKSLEVETSIIHRDNFEDHNSKDFDLVLSLNHPIKILNKKNTLWCSWVFNENLGTSVEEISKYKYDLYLTNSEILFNQFKDKNIESDLLRFPPFDFFSRKDSLVLSQNKEIDVAYFGNYNPEYKTAEGFSDFLFPCMNYKFQIYGGRKWLFEEQKKLYNLGKFSPIHFSQIYEKYYQGLIFKEECCRISDKAKIFVNFNSPNQSKLGMINNRMFDLLNNGCFIITDNSDCQKELFRDCVEYSSGKSDLKDKIEFYLNNPDLIIEKQNKALEFIEKYKQENNYQSLCKKIISFSDNKNYYFSKRKETETHIVIYVNKIELLDNCIKSILKSENTHSKPKFIFLVPKSNRIRATKIIQLYNLSEIILIDDSFDKNKLSSCLENIHNDSLIFFTYSNAIFNREYISKAQEFFLKSPVNFCYAINIDSTNGQKKIFGFDNGKIIYSKIEDCSLYPINSFIMTKSFLLNNEDLEIKDSLLDIGNQIVFESEQDRKSYFKDSVEKGLCFHSHNQVKKLEPIIEIKKETDSTDKIRYSIFLENKSFEKPKYLNYEEFIIDNIESTVRKCKSHYVILGYKEDLNWNKLNSVLMSYFNYEVILLGDVIICKTGILYQHKPCLTIQKLIDSFKDCKYSTLEIHPQTYDVKVIRKNKFKPKDPNGLKVALLSLCGVSSYEDKYGIGGEHQVIHWLKQSCEKRDDVYMCHIFDTYNYDLMNPDDYDIIFSNSCWRGIQSRRSRKDNLTIFWHFNMNAGRETFESLQLMGYDCNWTNSYLAYEWMKNKNMNCHLKQLNASSEYHHLYEHDSKMYSNDCAYIGGYQVYYKGKEMIDHFIKPCLSHNFNFSIYGNRLWKSEVQKIALQNDSYFKREYYDESFDPYYKGILPMQDFNVFCKNTKILINFNAIEQRKVEMNNDRVIWQLACGGFVITDDFPAARRFYEEPDPSNCPVAFSTGGNDLVDKIKYYLDHDQERLKVSSRGPGFIRKNKLYTDDTINEVIDFYHRKKKNEL